MLQFKYVLQYGKSNLLFVVVAAIAIAVGLLVQLSNNTPQSNATEPLPKFEKLAILPQPKSLGEVRFEDHNGKQIGQEYFQGKWTILFFAFTNCPDICPSTLYTLKQVKQNLVEADVWSQYQVAMVTVDPERDTTERLKSYVPFFDSEFVGLRADLAYTTEFAKNVGILFFKSKEFDNGGYDVDHGAALIFVNPQGKFAGVFNAPHPEDVLTSDLLKLGQYAKNERPSSQQTSSTANRTKINKALNLSAVAVEQAWIRAAPPKAMSMAGYFTVSNNGAEKIRIVSASSPLFKNVMMHETSMVDGLMSMDHVDGVDVAAGESVEFKPMGLHLMMMGPQQDYPVGNNIPVRLTLASGEIIDVQMPVKEGKAN